MSPSIDVSGSGMMALFYAVSLAAVVPLLAVLVWPPDDGGDLLVGVFIVVLVLASTVGLWRRWTGRTDDHLGTPGDIAWDPVAYPGQAAKEQWLKTVGRLPDDEDRDED